MEWIEVIDFLKEWAATITALALVGATVYLARETRAVAGATIALTKQSKATEELTKASIKASEALQTMPSLTFTSVQPISDGGEKYSRFSVKNVGYGLAKNLTIVVTNHHGKVLRIEPRSTGTVLEVDNLFYWDAYDVSVGDVLLIQISFTDIRGVNYPPFIHLYTVN